MRPIYFTALGLALVFIAVHVPRFQRSGELHAYEDGALMGAGLAFCAAGLILEWS